MGGQQTKPSFPKICDPILKEIREDQVVMYTKTHCGYCTQAKQLLNQDKVEFTEKNLEYFGKENPDKYQDYVNGLINVTHMKTVPQIFVCGNFVGGYTELAKKRERLPEMLKKCAIPKRSDTSVRETSKL